jgi:hypothetical protein
VEPRVPTPEDPPQDPPGSPTPIPTQPALRADFSLQLGTYRHYYDVQIVAVNKDSAREEAFQTLTEAADEKRRKYKSLGTIFHPLIFSTGGLMEKSTAREYKNLQKALGPPIAR